MTIVSNAGSLNVRLMRREDLDLAIEWAANEGWNPGLTDAGSFWAADDGGFLVGELGGEAVSVISAVRYGAGYGFIGLYIVRPDLRGRGYGLAVWQAAMKHLQGRTVGLDGVVAQQDNYRRSGFELAHRNARFVATRTSDSLAPREDLHQVVPLAAFTIAQVVAYDSSFFPEPRERFLNTWTAQPGTVAFGVGTTKGLQGYGALRPCRQGFKIGPLFADSPDIADALFCALVAQVPAGEQYFLDIMSTHLEALALTRRYSMQQVFETARMYLGAAPDIAAERTYGITSFELG